MKKHVALVWLILGCGLAAHAGPSILQNDLIVSGTVSAVAFEGDGSGLTGIGLGDIPSYGEVSNRAMHAVQDTGDVFVALYLLSSNAFLLAQDADTVASDAMPRIGGYFTGDVYFTSTHGLHTRYLRAPQQASSGTSIDLNIFGGTYLSGSGGTGGKVIINGGGTSGSGGKTGDVVIANRTIFNGSDLIHIGRLVVADQSTNAIVQITATGGVQVGTASFHQDISGNIWQDGTNSAGLGVVSGVSFRAYGPTGFEGNASGATNVNAKYLEGKAASALVDYSEWLLWQTNIPRWVAAPTGQYASGSANQIAMSSADGTNYFHWYQSSATNWGRTPSW